jgi:hypothetical protein
MNVVRLSILGKKRGQVPNHFFVYLDVDTIVYSLQKREI